MLSSWSIQNIHVKLFPVISCVLIFFIFIAAGCKETAIAQEFTIGRAADFQLNQLYISADGRYRLKITELGDSRCPEGVVCIWQGEVTVKGEWTEHGKQSNFELHSLVTDQQKLPEGSTIQLRDAKPYPRFGTETRPEDLVVTLLIQGNGVKGTVTSESDSQVP